MKRETFTTLVAYLFILLFLYTAISKWLSFSITHSDMRRNPLLGDMPLFWTIVVPAAEIVISVLLFLPATRRIGLWATVALMVAFTGYVGVLLASDYHLPCTCGGIFRALTWKQHLWVNIGLVALAISALTLYKHGGRNGNHRFNNDFIAQ